MARVELPVAVFKSLVSAVKNCVAKDNSRPILKYIKLNITKEKLTAYACNGYAIARYQWKNDCRVEVPEDITCFVRPVQFTRLRDCNIDKVVIETDDEGAHVTVPYEYGTITYHFTDGSSFNERKFSNADDIISAAASTLDKKKYTSLSAGLLADVAQTFKECSVSKDVCTLYIQDDDRSKPIIFTSSNDTVTLDYLVLPMRYDAPAIPE